MPGERSEERLHLMADVATMYYVDGLSQNEIAHRVGGSRSAVSSLLQEAHEQGIVTFRINHPLVRINSLERELKQQFGLAEVRVVEQDETSEDGTLDRIGQCAESLLSEYLHNGMLLGISPGTGVSAAVQALRPRRLPDVKVIQLTGGLGSPHRLLDAAEQCAIAGEAFGAQPYYLNAPLVVDSPTVATALKQDPSISRTLDLASQTEVALMGIGAVEPQVSTQFHAGYLSYDDLLQLAKLGIVGGLCTSFFNVEGQHIPAPWLDSRVIGISWEDLSRIGTIIGIAAGQQKARAVLGAVRSRLIHTLVVDDSVAQLVLHLHQKGLV